MELKTCFLVYNLLVGWFLKKIDRGGRFIVNCFFRSFCLQLLNKNHWKKSITNDDFRWLFMIFWKASKMFSKGILWTKNGLETSLTLFSSQISLTDKSRAYKKYHQIPLKSSSYNGFGPERLWKEGVLKPKEKLLLRHIKKYLMQKFGLPKDSKRLKFQKKDVPSIWAKFFPNQQL